MIERDDIDIVDICTPGHLHAEIALAALAAGKHVLVEKPLANTVAEAELMVAAAAAADAHGVRSMVGFNYRRVPALALARELIARGPDRHGAAGAGGYLQDWLADAAAPMTWRLRKETAGSGALGDLGSHVVDQVRYLLGEPVVVGVRPPAHVRARAARRRRARSRSPSTTPPGRRWRPPPACRGQRRGEPDGHRAQERPGLEVYGDRGSISFDLERLNELHVLDGPDGAAPGARRVLVTEADHPYLGAWWPPGHVLGWDHTFTIQAADLLRRDRRRHRRRRRRSPTGWRCSGCWPRSRSSAAGSWCVSTSTSPYTED